jgi:hypothetical protein
LKRHKPPRRIEARTGGSAFRALQALRPVEPRDVPRDADRIAWPMVEVHSVPDIREG